MTGTKPPRPAQVPPPILADAKLKKLVRSCTKRLDFYGKRDLAILRILMCNGTRRTEVANLQLTDLDLEAPSIRVVGKGNKIRIVPLTPKATKALRQYLTARSKYPTASLPNLWIGHRGAITGWGIYQILRKRAQEAGVDHVHPHRFRHTWAHNWLHAGGSESDAMAIGGWSSRQSMDRYIKAEAATRARENHKRIKPSDNI